MRGASRAGRERVLPFVVGGILADLAGSVLLVLAFARLGEALYTEGTPPPWWQLAAPLAGAAVLLAAGTLLGGWAGAALSLRLRRRALNAALAIDPDQARRVGAGGAVGLALDLDLIGGFLLASASATALGAIEVTLAGGLFAVSPGPGLGDLQVGPWEYVPAAAVLVAALAATLAAMAALTYTLRRRRAIWTEWRTYASARLVERISGTRTVSVQDDPARAAAVGDHLHENYRRASARMDLAALALSVLPLSAGVVLFATILTAEEPAPATAAALGTALLAVLGLVRLANAAADGAAALDAVAGLRTLDGMRAGPVPTPGVAPIGVLARVQGLTALHSPDSGLARGVDLNVEPGRTVLLTGPSGSGKSTLGEVLAGHRAPSTGSVELAPGTRVGRVVQAGDAYILQASLLFNLLCTRVWPPQDCDIDDALAVLDALDLTDLLNRLPGGLSQPIGDGGWRLSAGEIARVTLARALLANPDLLILDETTAPMDPVGRRRLLAAAAQRCSTLLVIHHP